MSITPEIQALITQLNQELDRVEQGATKGLNLGRILLSRFPDNPILIQFFSLLSNSLFLVANYRKRSQETVKLLSSEDVPLNVTQEIGEELATMLGVVLEAKIRAERIITRLEDLS